MKNGNINRCHAPQRPSSGSLCTLLAIWQVNVNESYLVHYRSGAGKRILIRTIDGGGEILLTDGTVVKALPGVILFLGSEEIVRYRTAGKRWQFFWFEILSDALLLGERMLAVPNRIWEIPFFYQLQTLLSVDQLMAARAGSEMFGGFVMNLAAEKERWEERDPRIVEILEFINEESPRIPAIGELARRFGVCARQFRNIFRGATGMSPQRYCSGLRMQQAQRLLQEGSFSVKEVSEMVGFANQFVFSAAYRKAFACAPSEAMRAQNPACRQ